MRYDIYQRYSPSSPETSSCEDGEDSGDNVDDKSFLMDIKKRNQIENIIMFYKEHSILWDTTNSEHENTVRRHEAYKDIAKRINEQMCTNFKWQNIKTEIDKLKAKFRQEYKQSRKNLDNDNENDDCDGFAPRVSWFYEQLSFLKDHIGCNRKDGNRMDSNTRMIPLSENKSSTENNACKNCKTLLRKIDNLQESVNNLCRTVKQSNESIMSAINVRQQASIGAATNEFPIKSEKMLQDMEEKITSDNRDIYGRKTLDNSKLYLPLSKFSLEKNLKFIGVYKSYACLWDISHTDYRFKDRRQEILKELVDCVNKQFRLNLPLEDLQKKIYRLHSVFSQEKHRQIKSANLNNDNIPQCRFYEELKFLEDSVGPFKCEYCEQLFNGPDQYRMHKSTHDGSMPYNCPIYHKGFRKVGNCIVHLRRHTKDFQFDCKECGKKFPTSTELKTHRRQHTGEKPYFCHICGESFRTWTYFDSHQKRHAKNPTHKCSICSKRFYEKNRLNLHIKTHLNVRDKICNVCGKSFTCTKYLTQHKRINAETKKYSCKICNKTFAQNAGLSGHIKSHVIVDYTVDSTLLE